MRDSIYVGGTAPNAEDCEQLGPDYDAQKARKEARAYVNQLRRVYGEEPLGARLFVKSNPHDFGTYLSVECEYNDALPDSVDYAFKVESGCDEWDDEARKELGLTTA